MSTPTQKAQSVFFEALDQQTAESRKHFVDRVCGSDEELKARVDELLQAHQMAGDKFLAGSDSTGGFVSICEKPGDAIGTFKLLQQIGEGGFGVVFMAEQARPVRRKVALKIIKAGMDTREIVARFEAERQTLALMDHPNIAKVFDGGSTESGRPYFVMELVKGVPLNQYCDKNHLSAKERLGLFVDVCHAIQHAHQKGVIHRDLKPSNIMVTLHDGKPVPKVIDFGVSKALNQQLTERTLFTAYGQMVGTPAYMSPEQAEMSGLDIDTRSDIYSLGVLLYEMLTGTTPFDSSRLRDAGYAELQRIIREEEPPIPSKRITTLGEQSTVISTNRRSDPKRLGQLVRGDLDWIVMKALDKDRNRRYETANGFAADIQRFLSDQPVVACPPSATYRFRKFARRNKIAIGTIAAVACSLIIGIIGTTWMAFSADRARVRAVAAESDARHETLRATEAESLAEHRLAVVRKQKEEIAKEKDRANLAAKAALEQYAVAQSVVNFLHSDLLAMTDQFAQFNGQLTLTPDPRLRTLLDRAAEKIESRFNNQPKVEAAIRYAIGGSYQALGLYEQAEPHLQRAVDLRQRELGNQNELTIRSQNILAFNAFRLMQNDRAEKIFRSTLKYFQENYGEEDNRTLVGMQNLAHVLLAKNQFSNAENLYRQSLDIQSRVFGSEARRTFKGFCNLAWCHFCKREYQKAEDLIENVLKHQREKYAEDDPDLLVSLEILGNIFMATNRLSEAEQIFSTSLAIRTKTLGNENPMTIRTMNFLAGTYSRQSRFAEAESLQRQILEIKKNVMGKESIQSSITSGELGVNLSFSKREIEAIPLLRESLRVVESALGPNDPQTFNTMQNLAGALYGNSQFEEAEKLHREVLKRREVHQAADHPFLLNCKSILAVILIKQGKFLEATSFAGQLVDYGLGNLSKEYADSILQSMEYVCWEVCRTTKLNPTEYAEALRIAEAVFEQFPTRPFSQRNLAMALYRNGNVKEAIKQFNESQSRFSIYDYQVGFIVAMAHWKAGDQDEALKHFVKTQSHWGKLFNSLDFDQQNLRHEAESLIAEERLEAYCTKQILQAPDGPEVFDYLLTRAMLYQRQSQLDKAAEDYLKVINQLPEGTAWDSARNGLQNNLAANEDLFERLIQARPNDRGLLLDRGRYYGMTENWAAAAKSYLPYPPLGEIEPYQLYEIGCVLILNDDRNSFDELLQRMEAELDESALSMFILGRTASVAPHTPQVSQKAIDWSQRAVKANANAWQLHALGMNLYRAGKYQSAIKKIRESESLDWHIAGRAQNWVAMALALHANGNREESQLWWKRAMRYRTNLLDKAEGRPVSAQSIDWLGFSTLYREAKVIFDQK